MSIRFHDKNKALIIALHFINGIIVNKITCTIQDWFLPVELYPSNHMTGMTKNHISACINERMSKGNMFCRGNGSPIWSPMSRYDQKIDHSFCLTHQIQKLYSTL